MGVVAAVMAARTRANGVEKATWMLLIGVFLVIEVLAIRKDRQDHDIALAHILNEEITARKEAKDNFSTIGAGISASVTQSQSQFQNTLSGLEENIKMITGGDSFAYLMTSGVDATGANLVLLSQGRYPLYDISVRVFDVKAMYAGRNFQQCTIFEKGGMEMGRNLSAKEGEGLAQQLGYVRFTIPGDRQDMNVLFSARNGLWEQVWRWRNVKGNWYWATTVKGNFDPKRSPNGTILLRKVMKGFPEEDLKSDGDWQNDLKLPLAF
jgi:hypothetical protein